MKRTQRTQRITKWLMGLMVATLPVAAVADSPANVAAKVNRLLRSEVPSSGATTVGNSTDAVFLRRVFFDVIGEPPTPDDVAAFQLSGDQDKRDAIVKTLLKDPGYARNWARFWRDVIMYRRSEDRAVIGIPALTRFLQDSFSRNRPWDEIVRDIVTAEGDVREEGATGLIMAQSGRPEDTVSEISRIFLGIQIQCAQCHDHPADKWTREQFHQLAAFFPRVAVRLQRNGDDRTFLVTVTDRSLLRRPRNNNNRFRGTLEHRMPNLEEPTKQGKWMKPAFFVNGKSVEFGVKDADRRGQLAEWITDKSNPWFAQALVNRLWAELVGEPFYDAIDDIGPGRKCHAPKTVAYLATEFANSDYDVQWLLRTIIQTEAYQRASQPRRLVNRAPFQANCPQRLRGDQLFDALRAALDIGEGRLRPSASPYAQLAGPRGQFNRAFGYDPSQPKQELAGSIPQALFLMNSSFINQAINARRNAGLGKLLRDVDDDSIVISELYLRTLARQPTRKEHAICLQFVRGISSRQEAYEDLLWSLVNSTEFLYRN